MYLWQGRWGPLRIRSHCEECDVTRGIIRSMQDDEFASLDVEAEFFPWLDNWWYCLLRGAWHAPIVFVDGVLFHQHSKRDPLVSRQALAAYVHNLND